MSAEAFPGGGKVKSDISCWDCCYVFSTTGHLILGVSFVYVCLVEHDLDQIDYIDSCATEEEEEEVRQPKCMESESLSSQFMAYIEQLRISHEVVLLFKLVKFIYQWKSLGWC